MKERTIEIVSWCPFGCSYCSSATAREVDQKLTFEQVCEHLRGAKADCVELIHISGGEPLFHPEIGWILWEARQLFGRGVILHTNLIQQIGYNPTVCEGIRIHAYMTPDEVDEVHILKRIAQGREASAPVLAGQQSAAEPAVHCSTNWREQCQEDCDHLVIRPDNTIVKGPCRKFDPVR